MVRQVMESEKVDKTLPLRCLIIRKEDDSDDLGVPAIITRGQPKVRKLSSVDSMTLEACVELNVHLCKCTPHQMTAMFVGVTEGWLHPAAFASYWENQDTKRQD